MQNNNVQKESLENLKIDILSVVGSDNNGVLLNNLADQYYTILGKNLNYSQFGFVNLIDFIGTINDIKLVKKNGSVRVFLETSKNAPEALKRLTTLINQTETKKKKGNKNVHLTGKNFNRKHKADNHLSLSTPTVTNGFNTSCNISAQSGNGKTNTQSSVVANYSTSSSSAIRYENFQVFTKNDLFSLPMPIKTIHPTYDDETPTCKLVGIQSGVAFLTFDSHHSSQFDQSWVAYININNYRQITKSRSPGTVVLWQLPDDGRSALTAVIPVIIKDVTVMKVQIYSSTKATVIYVNSSDLFNFSERDLLSLKSTAEKNNSYLNFIRLMGVPSFVDFWNKDKYSDSIFRFFIMDNDKLVLENRQCPGKFLNVTLMVRYMAIEYENLSSKRKKSFFFMVQTILKKCLTGLEGSFREMLMMRPVDKENVHTISPLSLVYRDSTLDPNLVFIGCESVSHLDLRYSHRRCVSGTILSLNRIARDTYNEDFRFLDDQKIMRVAENDPFFGLYSINDKYFTFCSDSRCRFMIAMVKNLPSILTLNPF